MKTLHVELNLTLNETDWGWNEPRATERISFQIPVVMADGASIAKLFNSTVKELEAKFPEMVKEFEAKKAEEEKAKAELSVN